MIVQTLSLNLIESTGDGLHSISYLLYETLFSFCDKL